jgi:hypothetical protein
MVGQSVAIYQHPTVTYVCIAFQFKFHVSQVYTAITPGVTLPKIGCSVITILVDRYRFIFEIACVTHLLWENLLKHV